MSWWKALEKRLVDDWCLAWRWWSLRFNAVGLLILGAVNFDPAAVMWIWNGMPPYVRIHIPPSVLTTISWVLFLLAMLSRMVKQKPPECHGPR